MLKCNKETHPKREKKVQRWLYSKIKKGLIKGLLEFLIL